MTDSTDADLEVRLFNTRLPLPPRVYQSGPTRKIGCLWVFIDRDLHAA
jgi:hypothetical protein